MWNEMGILNIFDYLIGVILIPFHSFHPFSGLVGVCIFITAIGLIVYKKVTNQERLKQILTEVKLSLMEMRLRHHNIGEMIRLQNEALAWNFRYLKTALLPSMVIFIPIILMLPSINARFEFIPARVGTIVSVEAILSSRDNITLEKIKLENVPEGLKLIEKDFSYGVKNVAGWYFRALKKGVFTLKFRYGENTFEKQVIVSDKIIPLQAEIKPPGLLDYFYSVESSSLEAGWPIESVAVGYKKAYSPFSIFGWHPDWIYSFMLIFLILFFILRPIMKVY